MFSGVEVLPNVVVRAYGLQVPNQLRPFPGAGFVDTHPIRGSANEQQPHARRSGVPSSDQGCRLDARRRCTSACTVLAAAIISGYALSVTVTNPVLKFSPSPRPVSGSSPYLKK